MKWKSKSGPKPKMGATRIVKKFIYLPYYHKGIWYWWEYMNVLQRCCEILEMGSDPDYFWVTIYPVDNDGNEI